MKLIRSSPLLFLLLLIPSSVKAIKLKIGEKTNNLATSQLVFVFVFVFECSSLCRLDIKTVRKRLLSKCLPVYPDNKANYTCN